MTARYVPGVVVPARGLTPPSGRLRLGTPTTSPKRGVYVAAGIYTRDELLALAERAKDEGGTR